jgi:hypothetical protein
MIANGPLTAADFALEIEQFVVVTDDAEVMRCPDKRSDAVKRLSIAFINTSFDDSEQEAGATSAYSDALEEYATKLAGF